VDRDSVFFPGGVLSLGFVIQRPLDASKTIKVFDFNDRGRLAFTFQFDMQVHVGINPQAAMLHVAI